MRLHESGTTSYWLNYFAESIKDDIESKGGSCKIQLCFTGNILFVRGYCSLSNYTPEEVLDTLVHNNPVVKDIFGIGIKSSIIYISQFPSNNKNVICHTYHKNKRPLISPHHNTESLINVSESPFGWSIDYKIPLYYGEYVAKDLLKFTKSDMVHIDFAGDEDLSLHLKSIYPKKSVESCVLDIYDFDFESFKSNFDGYDFKQEILEPYGEKPWLKDSKLSEYIIF